MKFYKVSIRIRIFIKISMNAKQFWNYIVSMV